MSGYSNFNAPRWGIEGFYHFIGECPHKFPKDSSLADYIEYWVWSGDGVLRCFGSFEILLQTIPYIVDAWHRNPEILDFDGDDQHVAFQRRASSAFGDDQATHAIFDRNHFAAAVFMRQEGL